VSAATGQRIVLVRHGQSLWNIDRRLTGHTDVPLSDEGRAQARALRPRLASIRFDGIWSSDLSRAVETAQLALGEPRVDPRLREIDFGALEGLRWDALHAEQMQRIAQLTDFAAPQGESFHQLSTRVHAFLDSLPGGTWAVVAHVGVIRCMLHRIEPARIVPNASAIAWDRHAGAVVPLEEWARDEGTT
jgi:broad specificity phosphatase PhoE